MQLVSPLFILFLIINLVIYYIIPNKIRYISLLVISLYFYSAIDKDAILYLFCFIILTYTSGIFISLTDNHCIKRWLFALSIGGIVLFLIGTKYIVFAIDNINRFGIAFSKESVFNPTDIIVPVGISYFTLSSVGYIVDVYQNKCIAEKNILKYALFIVFFPIVSAGPIERSGNFLLQLRKETNFNYCKVRDGLILVAWGFYKKTVIADPISKYIDDMYTNYMNYGSYSIIVATFLFSIVLYADFSGYSDIAVGIGKAFGFDLIVNFRQPYFAQSVGDFWRRWHISLSSWLRDYIYIPLGGNRKGAARKYINIIIVFLVSGLWHGCGWTFVIWGGLHGVFQIAEGLKRVQINRYNDNSKQKEAFLNRIFRTIKTFILVTIAWFFFRVDNANAMLDMIKYVLTNWDDFNIGISIGKLVGWIIMLIPVLVIDIAHEKNIRMSSLLEKQPIGFRWMCYATISIIIMVAYMRNFGQEASTFLYVQF